MRVGMIGLGQIGLPIAINLMKSGFQVTGFRRGDKSALIAAGGIAAASPQEVANSCEVVVSCLPDAEALESVVSGPQGILSAKRRELVLIELSTLPIPVKEAQAKKLKEIGVDMLDCAISGVPRMVQNRQGVVFVSGDRAAYERGKAVIDGFTDKVFFLGPFGYGTKIKLIANLLVSLNIMATAEAMTLGLKAGIPGDLLVSALKDGAGGSLQFQVRAPVMANRAWDTVMAPTKMLVKDIELIDELSGQLGCPVPLLSAARQYYDEAMRGGYADKDVASLFAVLAKHANLQ